MDERGDKRCEIRIERLVIVVRPRRTSSPPPRTDVDPEARRWALISAAQAIALVAGMIGVVALSMASY